MVEPHIILSQLHINPPNNRKLHLFYFPGPESLFEFEPFIYIYILSRHDTYNV